MIKVYTPFAPLDIFKEWFGDTTDYVRCENCDEVLSQELKIACLPIYFEQNYTVAYEKFDLLLLSDIEFNHIRPINEWLKKLEIKNYLLAVGGLEDYTVSGDVIYRPWWTFNLMRMNSPQHQVIANPQFDFDILLGAKKPHRDFVMAKCQKSFLLNTSIVNYRSVFTAPEQTDVKLSQHTLKILDGEKLKYPYKSANMQDEWEVNSEIDKSVSSIVPWKIYCQTKYSTVLESIHENVFFFTEKPAKVLYAKRIFVAFSCHHYLKQMRELLGFKTFSDVIDESYDLEQDNIKRFEMAFEQMEWLAKQDYEHIKTQTESIVDYNYRRLFTLRQETAARMQQMVYNKIEEIKC